MAEENKDPELIVIDTEETSGEGKSTQQNQGGGGDDGKDGGDGGDDGQDGNGGEGEEENGKGKGDGDGEGEGGEEEGEGEGEQESDEDGEDESEGEEQGELVGIIKKDSEFRGGIGEYEYEGKENEDSEEGEEPIKIYNQDIVVSLGVRDYVHSDDTVDFYYGDKLIKRAQIVGKFRINKENPTTSEVDLVWTDEEGIEKKDRRLISDIDYVYLANEQDVVIFEIDNRFFEEVGVIVENRKLDEEGRWFVNEIGKSQDDESWIKRNGFALIGDKVEFTLVTADGDDEHRIGVVESIIRGNSKQRNKVTIEDERTSGVYKLDISSIVRLIESEEEMPQEDPYEVFNSLSWQIINEITQRFKDLGVFPFVEEDAKSNGNLGIFTFLNTHLPTSMNRILRFLMKIDGKTVEVLENKYQTTLAEVKELDTLTAKSILRETINNPNYLDPHKAFGTVLYDCFDELGVFGMVNTEIFKPIEGKDVAVEVSVFRDKDVLTVMSAVGGKNSTFVQDIMFGGGKNLIKFALWQDHRTERINELYNFIMFLRVASEQRKVGKKVTEYPEINNELSVLYINQLKALENAI